jgi:hypothetical protein
MTLVLSTKELSETRFAGLGALPTRIEIIDLS